MEFYVLLTAFSSVFFMSATVPLSGDGSYLETSNPYSALDGDAFEGDMILTAAQRAAIEKRRKFPKDGNDESDRNGLRDFRKRWPNKTVVFHIKENVFDEKQIEMIYSALSDIANQTCIKFRKRESVNEHAVIIQGEEEPGCQSHIGYIFNKANQSLNLAKKCFQHGTIMHEMLHTIGFVHMQSTYDRDQFVTILWHNIREGKEVNFSKYTTDTVTDFGVPYDYGSVMHYFRKAFSKNGKDTVVPKQANVEIGQRVGLSKSDVLKVKRMYECP